MIYTFSIVYIQCTGPLVNCVELTAPPCDCGCALIGVFIIFSVCRSAGILKPPSPTLKSNLRTVHTFQSPSEGIRTTFSFQINRFS